MSLVAVERYIHNLEALKYYPEVKHERDELADENAQLKVKCSGLEKEVEGLRAELSHEAARGQSAEEELGAKVSLTEKLEAKLEKASNELKALREFELKSTGGRNLTLEQARGEFLKAQESEIERRANEKYGALKADYEARMPKLVHEKLVEILKKQPWPKEIAGAIESKAGQMASEILINKERWPDWFRELYLKEVKAGVSAGLDAEFERRVEGGATERAEKKLMQLTRVEWPKWYEANVKPKLSDLEAKIKENVIGLLRGPWRGIRCEKCGAELGQIELTEQGISDLFSIGHVEKECTNPDCREWDRIRRHRIRISLYDLIAAYIRG